MSKTKVLYVDTGFGANWGGSKSLLNLINSVKNEIEPVIFFTSKVTDGTILNKSNLSYSCIACGPIKISFSIRPLKKIFSYPFKVIKSLFYNVYAIYKITQLIKKEKIDIVHSNTSVFAAGLIAAKLTNVKHVWHLREYQFEHGLHPFFGFNLLRALIKKSDAVISITQDIKKFFKSEKADVIYDAVLKEIPNIVKKTDENYLLFCGALSQGKSPTDALNAFLRLAEHHPTLRLKIAGTGPLEKKLKQLADESGYRDRIEFLGHVADPLTLFANARVFLMTSLSEGLGRVTIEAMLCGCPVVGRNSGGTAELISNGKNGYLFDSFEQLVSQIELVLTQPETETAKLTDEAKKWAAERFLEDKYGQQLMRVYDRLMKR